MKSFARKLPVLAGILLVMFALGCATQTHPIDRLLWEGIDEPGTNAPPAK